MVYVSPTREDSTAALNGIEVLYFTKRSTQTLSPWSKSDTSPEFCSMKCCAIFLARSDDEEIGVDGRMLLKKSSSTALKT